MKRNIIVSTIVYPFIVFLLTLQCSWSMMVLTPTLVPIVSWRRIKHFTVGCVTSPADRGRT